MREPKFREVKFSAQGHTAFEQKGEISSLDWALKWVLCLLQKAMSSDSGLREHWMEVDDGQGGKKVGG